MAQSSALEFGAWRFRFSYKQATIVVCAGNMLVGLYMLHFILSPIYFHSQPSAESVQNWEQTKSAQKMEEEEKRLKEVNAVRLRAVPHLLIQRVKEIQAESESEAAKSIEAGHARQKVAAELAEKLKELMKTNKQTSEQVDEWRKKKLEQAKQRGETKDTQDSREKLQEKESKKMEVGWDPVLGAVLEDLDSKGESPEESNLKETDIENLIALSKPFASECHPEYHTDYDGIAVRWGLTHPTQSAVDCCQACLDQAKNAKEGELKCNIWVYCPLEGGCFSPDIYEHKEHECWLKQAPEPKLNFKGTYSEEYRAAHPTAPALVPWVSGVTS